MALTARPQASPDPSALGPRRQAVWLLGQVLRHHRTFDDSFAEITSNASRLPGRERAFLRALAATGLRRLGQIEHLLGRFLARPLARKSGAAREILVVGAAQILFMRVPVHAAIDTAVEMARCDRDARHFTGLINAVLRRLAEAGLEAEEDGRTLHLNTPAWLWRRWCAHYGEATAWAIAERHAQEPPLDITVKADPEQWAQELGGAVLPTGTVRIAAPRGRIEDLPGYRDGGWWVQDAAAALPARLIGAAAGLRVLDLCAAPGGKTMQLAAAGARVTAVDIAPTRLERLVENLSRTGLAAEIAVADAAAFKAPEPFDAVLLDAPCTSTGIIRRNPDIPLLKTESDVAAMAVLQARMLDNAMALVKPGGVVVYCTCSLEPEEGEAQIAALLGRNGSVIRSPIAANEIGGMSHLLTPEGDLRTLPAHPIGEAAGLDGFYAARLQRG